MKLRKSDFILLGAILFLFFIFDCYADIVTTYLNSIGCIEAIAHGRFFSFYEYAKEFVTAYKGSPLPIVYPFLIYFIFALWNLPIWILHQITGVSYLYPLCLLWCKGLLLLFSAGSVRMLGQILKNQGYASREIRLADFLFASSLFFVLPVFAVAQYDIISVFFILWGLKCYLDEDRISLKTIGVFSIAVTLKYFALFLFVPLVLMREKRVFACLADIGVSLLPAVLGGLLFPNHGGEVETFYTMMTETLLGKTLPGGNTEIPVFIALWLGLAVWAYFIRPDSRDAYFQYAVWAGAAAYLGFFCFVDINPYWVVLAAPFLVLLILQNQKNSKINLILEFFLCLCASLVYIVKFDWVYLYNTNMHYLLFELFKVPAYEERKFSQYWNALVGEEWLPVLFAVFVVCSIAMLIINYPKKKEVSNQEGKLQVDHGMLYLRLAVLALYIGTDIMLYIWTHVKNLLYPVYAALFKH